MASLKLRAAWAYNSKSARHSGQGIFRVLPERKGMGAGVIADNDIEASIFVRRNRAVSLSRWAHAPTCVKFFSTGKAASFREKTVTTPGGPKKTYRTALSE